MPVRKGPRGPFRGPRRETPDDQFQFPSWMGPWDIILWVVVCLHLYNSPYTKIEENFDIQAIHDFLYYRTDISSYAHRSDPSAVPHSLLPAAVLSLLSSPLLALLNLLGPRATKALGQVVCRLVIGTITTACLGYFRRGVRDLIGNGAAAAFSLLTCLQFHIPYHASRTLPDTFSLAAASLALGDYLSALSPAAAPGQATRAIATLAAGALALKGDLALLLGLVTFDLVLFSKKIPGRAAIAAAGVGAAGAAALTTGFDSLLCGRLTLAGPWSWWHGVARAAGQPALFYLTSALPRTLSGSLALVCASVFADRRATRLLAIGFGYTVLMSLFPAKEVRFLFPVLPLLNAAGGAAFAAWWSERHMAFDGRSTRASWSYQILITLGALCCVATLLTTWMGSAASYLSYPGGIALHELHNIGCPKQTCEVHVGTLAARTGVSPFGESTDAETWAYSKEEGLSAWDLEMRGYEFLVRETGQPVPEGYRVYGTVSAFADWDFYFPCGQDPLAAMMCPLFLKPPAYALMRVVPRVSVLTRSDLGILTSKQKAVHAQMRVKESFLEVGHQLERLSGALNQVASQGMEGMQEIIQEHATRTADEGSLAGTEGSTRVTGEGSGDSTEGGSTVATGAGSGVGGGDAKAERETIKEGAEKGNESDVAGDVQGGVGEERRGNAQGGAATAVEL